MILDRPISFSEGDLNFGNYQPPRPGIGAPAEANAPDRGRSPLPIPGRRDR
jgi:hypothetical protein